MSDEDGVISLLERIAKQNEILIGLVGRTAFEKKELKTIIMKNKKNPEKYIEGYNACNGRNQVTKIAKIVGIDKGTISRVLKNWEELGIIYEVEKPGGKFYKKIFPID